jgi:hypothetical protein
MRSLIADTLELWRDAERVLGEVAPSSPDHETVALLINSLRDLHARMSAAQEASDAAILSNREAIDEARALLVSIRARHSISQLQSLGQPHPARSAARASGTLNGSSQRESVAPK